MAAAAAANGWKPYECLTKAPTNLKEAIDWVLRVTGKDGKKNEKQKNSGPHCLCYLAKAVKDLLYDAGIQYSTENTSRDYTKVLLKAEHSIVNPVLTDLGLDGNDKSNPNGCGGTEVIKALIDQLAQGLQKWVGWKDGEECCLKGEKNGDSSTKESKGIGKACERSGAGEQCCNSGGSPCATHECDTCGKGEGLNKEKDKCYLSAYCKSKSSSSSGSSSTTEYLWTSISSDPDKVHLLARIFLGSVCLIWSGLSQLGFLTGGDKRWKESKLHDISTADSAGIGSFMAAMGYDLDRLNQGPGKYCLG